MQNYIIKDKNGTLRCFFYTRDIYQRGIATRKYENNKWGESKVIIENAREEYSISLAENGDLYLFCQNKRGDIILCRENNGKWFQNTILKSQRESAESIKFKAIITDRQICLIYNMPISGEHLQNLMIQKLSYGQKWQQAKKIDSAYPMNEDLFQVQDIGTKHKVIFYQKKEKDFNIGYREITTERVGEFKIFYSTGYQITDKCFMATDNSIHVLYIVRSMFSSQVIYRRKIGREFSNPVVLWEGQRLENCYLFIIKNCLYAGWFFNGQFYYTMSENEGEKFSKVIRHRGKISCKTEKALFLSFEKMEKSRFFMREVMVEVGKVWNIQIIPELCSEFYPIGITVDEEIMEEKKNEISQDIANEIEKLKNQLNMTRSQLNLKDKQIMRLTEILKNKNDEIVQNEARWQEKYREIYEENKKMKEEDGGEI